MIRLLGKIKHKNLKQYKKQLVEAMTNLTESNPKPQLVKQPYKLYHPNLSQQMNPWYWNAYVKKLTSLKLTNIKVNIKLTLCKLTFTCE